MSRGIFKRAGVFASLGLALVLLSPSAKAQTISYKPGTTITIDVAFDGKDAEKISTVFVWLNLTTAVKAGQDGFQNQWSGQAQKVGDKFQASFAVGDNQAAGTYQVNQIRAVMNPSVPVDFYYKMDEFPETSFIVDNPRTVDKPKIKSVTAH